MYKQFKTGWRFIVFETDILSVVAIFKTCRENRELCSDPLLWKHLCKRDFGSGETLRDYIDRYQMGSYFVRYSFKLDILTDIPRMVFVYPSSYLITFSRETTRVFHANVLKDSNYVIDEKKRIVHSEEHKCTHRILLQPLTRWILENFEVNYININKDKLSFNGKLLPNRFLIIGSRRFDASLIVEYEINYARRQLLYEKIPLTLSRNDEGNPEIPECVLKEDI